MDHPFMTLFGYIRTSRQMLLGGFRQRWSSDVQLVAEIRYFRN